jgi:hypothetical protein
VSRDRASPSQNAVGILASLHLVPPAASEIVNNIIAAPIDESGAPVDWQALNQAGFLTPFRFDGLGGLLQGLTLALLLACLYWTSASSDGEAQRSELASVNAALKFEVRVVEESERQQSNPHRHPGAPIKTRVMQIKATAIYTGYGGDGGQVMVMRRPRKRAWEEVRHRRPSLRDGTSHRRAKGIDGLPTRPLDARGFKSEMRNGHRSIAKAPRRTKPRQSVPVARAPPFA